MLTELIFKGIEVEKFQRNDLHQRVWTLKELSPSDAFIEVKVERTGGQYSISILIRHNDGEISTASKGSSLADLTHECFDKIHHSLRSWKKDRFTKPQALYA